MIEQIAQHLSVMWLCGFVAAVIVIVANVALGEHDDE
jgi:hypothetical protein